MENKLEELRKVNMDLTEKEIQKIKNPFPETVAWKKVEPEKSLKKNVCSVN